jgi:hypothetical protein
VLAFLLIGTHRLLDMDKLDLEMHRPAESLRQQAAPKAGHRCSGAICQWSFIVEVVLVRRPLRVLDYVLSLLRLTY